MRVTLLSQYFQPRLLSGSTTTCGNFTANVTGLTPSPVQGLNIVAVSLTFRADVSLNWDH